MIWIRVVSWSAILTSAAVAFTSADVRGTKRMEIDRGLVGFYQVERETFWRIARSAISPLSDAIAHPDPLTRRRALEALPRNVKDALSRHLLIVRQREIAAGDAHAFDVAGAHEAVGRLIDPDRWGDRGVYLVLRANGEFRYVHDRLPQKFGRAKGLWIRNGSNIELHADPLERSAVRALTPVQFRKIELSIGECSEGIRTLEVMQDDLGLIWLPIPVIESMIWSGVGLRLRYLPEFAPP